MKKVVKGSKAERVAVRDAYLRCGGRRFIPIRSPDSDATMVIGGAVVCPGCQDCRKKGGT